jgi:integrase
VTTPRLRLLDSIESELRADAEAGWLEWLVAHVDGAWRPREWDQEHWLFTGDLDNPRTVAWRCRTPSCPAVTRRQHGRCDTCRRAQAASGLRDEDFDREPRRAPFWPLVRDTCSVPGCERALHSVGLCFRHYGTWQKRKADGGSLEEFVAGAPPLRREEPCLVAGCPRERHTGRGLCLFHNNRLRREHDVSSLSEADVAAWAKGQPPRLGPHQFSLASLAEVVRLELLYCLQRRDKTPPPLDPLQVRIVVIRLAEAASVRHLDLEAVCGNGGMQYNAAAKGLVRDLGRHLERAWNLSTGADPFAGDCWEVAQCDLQSNGSRRYPATEGVVDFRPIGQRWLRQIAKEWARVTRPYLQTLRQAILACRIASAALTAVGRADPSSLDAGDFSRVADAITGHRRADGSLYSAKYRTILLYRFSEVLNFGRTNGLMAEVPDPFCSARRQRIVEDPNEDELGKALPEVVIRQLNEQLALLGPSGRCGSVPAADLQAMHQTIYRILRDTGRRPGEVVSLKVGCVEVINGQHNLIYDNHKAARRRRRLPITAETAQVILAWERHRAELPTPPAIRQWLFPSPLLRSHQSLGHLTASAVGVAFRAWVRRIPTIDSEVLGPDGLPLPFDRSLVTPYTFRHSYAQRHADAGVPVDVLKELLDHAAIQTTMGYYSVSLKRKQNAIRKVGSLAVDAQGSPSPFSSPLAYERASVSVPFGNCTEPSNVRAGGGHCPIRFQCAGCGFYRPDPSYLPALEEHIASLRADRETARAMDAADYVITNLSAEIDAFCRVAQHMRRRLSKLAPEERSEVEEASRILRRLRAARRIPVVASPGGQAG